MFYLDISLITIYNIKYRFDGAFTKPCVSLLFDHSFFIYQDLYFIIMPV